MTSPKTLPHCLKSLQTILPSEDVNCELNDNLGEFVSSYHSTCGRWLRNNWGLWDENSDLYKWFADRGFIHADDMSSTILKAYWCSIKDVPFNLEDEADKYRDYWKSMETMPVNIIHTTENGTKVSISIA